MHNFKQYYDVRTLQYVKPVKQIQTFPCHSIIHEHKDFSIFFVNTAPFCASNACEHGQSNIQVSSESY